MILAKKQVVIILLADNSYAIDVVDTTDISVYEKLASFS